MLNKKIGFIGYRGHVGRLIRAFESAGQCDITHLYHPEKNIELDKTVLSNPVKVSSTKRLDDLYKCDGVVISSPNHTHYAYIKRLVKEYGGYIFCEKPPVSSMKELEFLSNLPDVDKKRVYFNFNMRFGYLSEALKVFPEKYNLGQPIRISIVVGHGLALKKEYQSSWRADRKLHKMGVLETLGIHYLDLMGFLYGQPNDLDIKTDTHSIYGDSIDTCHLACDLPNRCFFTLTCSYCIPCVESVQINYTNGIIDFNNGSMKVYGPRETFNKNGFFIPPPLIYDAVMDADKMYLESLKNSCGYFMDCVCGNKPIELKYFEQSIFSNRACIAKGNG